MAEREIRSLIRELRGEEEAQAPSYERVVRRTAQGRERSRPPRRIGWLAAAGAVAVAVLVAVVLWRPAAPAPEQAVAVEALAAELSGWQAPLDFLLEVPAQEFLGSEPVAHGRARRLIELVEETSVQLKEVL